MKIIYALSLLLMCFATPSAHSAELPGISEFIDEMVLKHDFKRAKLEKIFTQAQYIPSVISIISRPATTRPWLIYRAAFVNSQRIKFGLAFWEKHRKALRRAEQEYGVPQEIILAVIGVETIYGQDAGTFRTLDVLTTLAFDYPSRAAFFRSELENLLLLAREQHIDLLSLHGSFAGAMGMPQFMPSSYRHYAVDFNGNHKIDLLGEADDAIASVANYLKGYGWISKIPELTQSADASESLPREGLPVVAPITVRAQVSEEICAGEITTPRTLAEWSAEGIVPNASLPSGQTARLSDFTVGEGKEFWLAFNNFEVIRHYNNSDFYAMTVFQLAAALKEEDRKINDSQ
jgi:membrane-bound lytic murein transglycosylase B